MKESRGSKVLTVTGSVACLAHYPANVLHWPVSSQHHVVTGTRFVPEAEERLLAVVHALLHRCYKMPFSNNAEVPASLKKELSGMPKTIRLCHPLCA